MQPLKFKPIYQNYIWGGKRIQEKYGRQETPIPCAESWELADRPEGMSRIAEGPLMGTTLQKLVEIYGERLLGEGRKDNKFPLLIKILDARENLSVQVHPSEESASCYGGEPKNEMWYFLEEGPIYAALKHPIEKKSFEELLQADCIEDWLRKIEVRSGEAVFIPGGRIHALGAGCFVFEVQQNSNTTYRIYDWGRNGRILHIQEALQCMLFDDVNDPLVKPALLEESAFLRRWEVISSLFFCIEKLEIINPYQQICDPKTFQIFFDLDKGDLTLLPAESEPLNLNAGSFLRVFLPKI